MSSTFGSKRRARKIQVDEDDDGLNQAQNAQPLNSRKYSQVTATSLADYSKQADAITLARAGPSISQPGKKAFKKSSLRQSIAFDEQEDDVSEENKPTIGRSNSIAKKKKASASRLSFGPGEVISGDAAEALEDDEAFTPKKFTLGRRIFESNASRKNLPIPNRQREDGDDERPTYSKDYLNELKSSTPTTPKDVRSLQPTIEDGGLDASELEGALVVDMDTGPAYIPSEAEIQEKKKRRARLAHEKDFISLNDHEGDGSQLSLLLKKKKPEGRLVREDEDLGEGFDEFVDDGRISLGKKQEREARKRHRKEMADMIHQAEGSEDDEEDDSEAERAAAYEAAQTRAGMDGLHKHDSHIESAASQVPSRITPLPVLSECLARLQSTMSAMELEMQKRHKKMADLEQEKIDILAREVEVQELLKQAGNRYTALKADSNGAAANPMNMVPGGLGASEGMVDRGLESFGNTPTTRQEVEDVG
ncbi:hypothetical protein D0Z07_2049 [Hyphodiscus hymeniophilus]|uniref:Nineteen complex-related protein 2-domain-containing protein n=1 Tax=Hyphodiscus hymeniophilus TaxID=353542 RepID=A0A9P7B006_9HELO|nr:hypothetical protein D0Z07_2049 [Hyphodiscus hymeniophilus]